ncbi:hypothetical protein [Halosimplex amylolyticum]|uniref:hypothetical protein n=1 Tax=Halosimplex amylolyticum TaxID=3396616 RepID=UPI003F56BF51
MEHEDVHHRGEQHHVHPAQPTQDDTDDDGPTATHDGETYHFCSRTCKRAFEDDPSGFTPSRPQRAGSDPSQGHDHH